ncbi:lytic transglycosylase domain-containing protein [Acinetobacter sp. A3.8]|uniref:Lytic transglycosylase domain-containing protein n=1 Tax=Acinetobacter sedimenti TaxID=2919922 RepID=A0A9X1WYJ6_9GAMM|nr:lytic transglycosylase domain-containing protein [Acinetobacter sedimenti]MCJ8146943.1 lytic transglycosylase domain-containing protein [Acinetobacter sedimenti]
MRNTDLDFFSGKNRSGLALGLTCKLSIQSLVIATIAGCGNTPSEASDEMFREAFRVSSSGNVALLDQYQHAMQDSVLSYYPEYWKLNQNLALQPSATIVSFARRYPQSAMAEKLSADYVEEKVRAGDFASAAPVLSYVTNADDAEACAIAQVRARTGDSLVLAEFKNKVWLTTDSQPESCNGLARIMLDSPLMTSQDRKQRLFTMLRAGNSGHAFAMANKMGAPLSLTQMNQIQANPMGYLLSAPKVIAQDHAYLIFALGRLADSDLNNAISMVDRLAQGVPEDVQKYLYRTVAYIGGTTVLKNNFNAVLPSYFDKSYGFPFSPEEAEIYARQSIRFGKWEGVIRAIDAMTDQQKQESRWKYWLARASEQRGDAQSKAYAQQVYQKIATQDDYHGLLAKARLKQNYSSFPEAYQPTTSDFSRLTKDVHFQRAFALRNIDAPENYINREWNWAVRQAYLKHDDGLILAAAKRATDMGWYDRAIYAADRTEKRHNYALRYPTPYQSTVVNYSNSVSINPAWAYGLMRQESRFNVGARSHVGAGGLMQIMPDTARLVARQMGESYDSGALSNMNTNIRYGTYYLSMIQGQLNGHPVLATAGYNAGPNRARRWQPSIQNLDADQYAESVPILETRDYVKHVMENAMHYGVVLGQGNQSINRLMYPIPQQF